MDNIQTIHLEYAPYEELGDQPRAHSQRRQSDLKSSDAMSAMVHSGVFVVVFRLSDGLPPSEPIGDPPSWQKL